jgi:predicted nucleic-acid-binding Zn-ribbon protein
MKTTGQCKKCSGARIWRVERIGVKDPQYSNGGNVPLGAIDRTGLESPGDRFATAYDGGHVDAYVCAACGYTELYWQGFEALRHNPEKGVHLLVGPVAGPYR